jgi:hypothetical protein
VCNQLLINPIIRTRTRLISGIHATVLITNNYNTRQLGGYRSHANPWSFHAVLHWSCYNYRMRTISLLKILLYFCISNIFFCPESKRLKKVFYPSSRWSTAGHELHQWYQHCSHSNCRGNTFNITWVHEPIAMILGMYLMPHEPISTAYFISPWHQWYQHCSHWNCGSSNLNITWMPEQMVMNLGIYIMLPEPISTA